MGRLKWDPLAIFIVTLLSALVLTIIVLVSLYYGGVIGDDGSVQNQAASASHFTRNAVRSVKRPARGENRFRK